MAAMRTSTLYASLLVVAIVATMATPKVEAQGRLLNGLIRVNGIIFCTLNGTVDVNGAATPAFPNATVQLRCGSPSNQIVIATSTTNNLGAFAILLDPSQILMSTLVSNCNLVVATPLATCNATLPSLGNLVSPLQPAGSITQGILRIFNFVPVAFQFVSTLIGG